MTPYQINEVMAPGTTYSSGVYSEVDVNSGGTKATSVVFFYKINQLDTALIDKGLAYTIIDSSNKTVTTGYFSDLIDTSKQLPDEVVILDTAAKDETYRVYLWLDSSKGEQSDLTNSSLDVELNGSIGSVTISGTPMYNEKLSTTISDSNSDAKYTYQWYYNSSPSTTGGTAIAGATESTYTVGSGMVGKYIYVVVTTSKGKTLSDITDASNNLTIAQECDNYNDGRVERTTPVLVLSASSGIVEAGPSGGTETDYPNAYNTFTTTVNKSDSYVGIDYVGTQAAVSANTNNVTIVSGASTSMTIGQTSSGSSTIKYHGEPSVEAQSNITVTFTPTDTANVCTVSKTYSVNKRDTTVPNVPEISLTDCDTFTYLATDIVGVTGYYISTSSTKPSGNESACSASNTLNCWTTNTTFSFTVGASAATYYVWAKDAAGNISSSTNTSLVKITRTEGTGTTLTTRYNSTSSSTGTVYTISPYVLKNCPIYSSAVANSGYNDIVLKHNGTSVTTTGTKATVTAAFSVESSATENAATITINKDGSAWSSSGMNVALYSGTTLKYAYSTATASGSTVVWKKVAPGTYNIYAGKSSSAKTELIDTGVDIVISASTSSTTGYSATINYYGLTLLKGTGISAVSNGGTSTTNAVQYLFY